jgi:hypothetical protein
VDYLDYVIGRAGLLCLAAFVWGIFCGLTDRELSGEPRDRSKA